MYPLSSTLSLILMIPNITPRGLILGGGVIHGRNFPFQKLVSKRPGTYTQWGLLLDLYGILGYLYLLAFILYIYCIYFYACNLSKALPLCYHIIKAIIIFVFIIIKYYYNKLHQISYPVLRDTESVQQSTKYSLFPIYPCISQ